MTEIKEGFSRKELWLHNIVIERLQKLADKKQWSLKQYMENVLIKDSNKELKK